MEEKDQCIRFLQTQISFLEEQLKRRPNLIQIISLGVSCFALGVALARSWLK